MESVESQILNPQEVVTIFREVNPKNSEGKWVLYPKLKNFFEKGFYIESFQQALIGTERYMITFSLRKINPSPYQSRISDKQKQRKAAFIAEQTT
jgi:hypothetical protein